MKVMLSLFAAIVLCSNIASADSRVTYSSYDRDNARIHGSIQFPGYGKVPADLVCLSRDGQTLKTTVEAETVKVCDESHLDRSDSENPRVVCDKDHLENVPTQNLTTPVVVTTRQCVRSVVDRSDSENPKTTCLQWADVTAPQNLTYEVETFDESDYRKESPISTERKSIGLCN